MIDYRLIRSDRRTLSIRIDREGALVVHAPKHMSIQQIEQFIVQKQRWIEEKQKAARSAMEHRPELESGAVLRGSENPDDYNEFWNDTVEPVNDENTESAGRSSVATSDWCNGLIRVIDAENVTITGEFSGTVLAVGGDTTIKVEDATAEAEIVVASGSENVSVEGEFAGTVTVAAKETAVTVENAAKVEVATEGAKVEVTGTVKEVAVTEEAKDTKVEVAKDAKVENVDYTEDGIVVCAVVDEKLHGQLREIEIRN